MIPGGVRRQQQPIREASDEARALSSTVVTRHPLRWSAAAVVALALAVAGCGGGSSSSSPSAAAPSATGKAGGTFTDPGQLQLRRGRPGAELHAAGVAAADRHPRRPDHLREGGRRGRDQDRARPGHLDPDAHQRRQDLRLPHPPRDQVLQRPGAQAERLRDDVRAPVHGARAYVVLLRHRRRERLLDQGLQPQQGRGRQRLRLHADHQPDRARPRAHGPAGAAVRVRGAGQHLAEAARQQRAAGHRAVHVEVVQPEHPGGAGPQPVLQAVERGRPSRPATRTRSSRSTASWSPTR